MFSIILAVVLLPIAAFATDLPEGKVARIGEAYYETIDEAILASQNEDIIVLVDNITLSEDYNGIVIPEGKKITIDLAGKTISQKKAQTKAYSMISVKGDLTIDDSIGGGKISYTDIGTTVVVNYISDTIANYGKLTVLNGTIENLSSETVANNGYPHAIDCLSNYKSDVTLNIKGGVISNEYYSAIRLFCNNSTYKIIANIEGGTIYNAVDFQLPSTGKLLGELNISGGEFKVKNGSTRSVRMLAPGTSDDASGMIASISGGSFEGEIVNHPMFPFPENFDTNVVTGGSFVTAPESLLAEGVIIEENQDGSYGAVKDKFYGFRPVIEGAQYRITGRSGLRFLVNVAMYNEINNNNTIARMGVLIIPTNKLSNGTALTFTENGKIGNTSYLDIPAKFWYDTDEESYMKFTAVLLDIPDDNRKFTAVAYIIYNDGTIVYSEPLERSIEDVRPDVYCPECGYVPDEQIDAPKNCEKCGAELIDNGWSEGWV